VKLSSVKRRRGTSRSSPYSLPLDARVLREREMFFFRDGEDKSARARSFTRAHKTTERDNSPRCAGTSKRSWPWSGHRRNRRRCSKLKEKYDLGEYKKAALCSAYKNKTPRPISRNGKRKRNLFRRADDDEEREKRTTFEERRERGIRRSVLLVILTIIIMFFSVCVCVFVRV
jgi:hypothetical protein